MVELFSLLFTIGKGSFDPLKVTEVAAILLFSTQTIIWQLARPHARVGQTHFYGNL